jgi:sortase A
VPAALPAGGSRLVLVTATGSSTIAPSDTLYVDATLTGAAQPATTVGLPDPAGAPMARDTSTATLAELVLALELLVAGLVGVAWARARWSRIGAWVAGVPLIVAALWLVSTLATRLLPNLA